jgi:hypothetical protein
MEYKMGNKLATTDIEMEKLKRKFEKMGLKVQIGG